MVGDGDGREWKGNGGGLLWKGEDWVSKEGKKKMKGCGMRDEECEMVEGEVEEGLEDCVGELGEVRLMKGVKFERWGGCWVKKLLGVKNRG